MDTITNLIKNVPIPKMVKVRQKFDDSHITAEEIPGIVMRELDREELGGKIKPGQRIAITCGSRGIHNYPIFVKAIIEYVRSKGAEPFIVAAMGSHGGATSKGQLEVLEGNGITEESMGVPVMADMDTVLIGHSERHGLEVRVDKNAAAADGIILFNRVKPHTSFRGRYESGLMKMCAIGLGKQHGASLIHHMPPRVMHEVIEDNGTVVLKNLPVLGGIAVIENAYDYTWMIKGLTPDEIITEEPKLRDLSYETIAHILFDKCDVLVVDKMGKNISGDGMDPNVTGRFVTKECQGTAGLNPEKLAILDLTDETHGNAQGIGVADCTTRRLFDKLVFSMTYATNITNTFLLQSRIPMVMDNDRECLQACLSTCPDAEDHDNMKMIHIHDTGHLEFIEISEALLPAAKANPNIEILSEPFELAFDENGNLF